MTYIRNNPVLACVSCESGKMAQGSVCRNVNSRT